MADRRYEGVFGWTWLGCGVVLFILVPLWVGLAAAFVHMLDRHDPEITVSFAQWLQGLLWSGVLLGLMSMLVVALWSALNGTSRIAEAISRRRTRDRYKEIVGDGDVLRVDSWALTDGPEPDPEDDVTEEVGRSEKHPDTDVP